MDSICSRISTHYPVTPKADICRNFSKIHVTALTTTAMARRSNHRNLPKNKLYRRREKDPPEFGVNLFLKKNPNPSQIGDNNKNNNFNVEEEMCSDVANGNNDNGDVVWEEEELKAISSLFQGRVPQKPGNLYRERPLPLPLPYKLRPLGLPTPKNHGKLATASRKPVLNNVYKNPSFLIGLAREINNLSSQEDVSVVLKKCGRFLRKGSLSMTIRELGHLGLPDRALQTFCWAQKQPGLFPDDRILASTIEVLARNHELKVPFNLAKFVRVASRSVLEAMLLGFIKGGSLKLSWKLLMIAKIGQRMLDPSVYIKMILELGKNPDKHRLVSTLLDELGERDDLILSQQDCTTIMKVCIRVGKFELVENLFQWYKQSGREPTVVMYTTMIHSRYSEKKYREALALVWEMESSECLFDLPAYRVVIKLFVVLDDLSRAARYFSKLKEAGFSPTYDVYRELIRIYLESGALAKCKDICKEAEAAGFKLEPQITAQLLQLESETQPCC